MEWNKKTEWIFLKLFVAECVEPEAKFGDERRQEKDEKKVAEIERIITRNRKILAY